MNIRLFLFSYLGIPHLPPALASQAIDQLMYELPKVPKDYMARIRTFSKYFDSYWSGKLELISIFDYADRPRTTNVAEARHSANQHLLGSKAHPSLCKFLKKVLE